jgi:hypothetical protein
MSQVPFLRLLVPTAYSRTAIPSVPRGPPCYIRDRPREWLRHLSFRFGRPAAFIPCRTGPIGLTEQIKFSSNDCNSVLT